MNKARARVNALYAYKKVNTYIISLLPICFGLAMIIIGDDLWETDDLGVHSPYSAASQVPESPESWGWAAVVFGMVTLIGEIKGNSKVLVPGLVGLSLWYMFFSISFIWDYIEDGTTKTGLAPATTYFVVSFLFVNRLWYSITSARVDGAK